MTKTLTQDRLKELLHYAPGTGLFTHSLARRGVRAGSVAGSTNYAGYIAIRVDGRKYMAHRLSFLYMTGEWPSDEVDHRNRIRDDNRWDNLRESSSSQNKANKISSSLVGLKGVNLRPCGKYHARIQVNRKTKSLGYFFTAEEAHAAYVKAANDIFGEFAQTA